MPNAPRVVPRVAAAGRASRPVLALGEERIAGHEIHQAGGDTIHSSDVRLAKVDDQSPQPAGGEDRKLGEAARLAPRPTGLQLACGVAVPPGAAWRRRWKPAAASRKLARVSGQE